MASRTMVLSMSFDFNACFMDSFENTYPVSPDPEEVTGDVLSNITADPLILNEWLQNLSDYGRTGLPSNQTEPVSALAFTYNEEVVQRRVAESAFAEPWTGINPQIVGFSSTVSLPFTSLTGQPHPTSVQVDETTDSGYISQICKPLVCPVCSKAFKNKAEEKKHSSTHSRPFKCKVKDCNNTKGFATSNDLERHQKDIHLIQPRHGPRSYYKCALPTCSKRDKMWSRKDNFKAHILRMHKGMDIDVDRLVTSSEFVPSRGDMEFLARHKCAQANTKSRGKGRSDDQSTTTFSEASLPQHTNTQTEADSVEIAYPVWQASVPHYLEEMPQEAAEMVLTRGEMSKAQVNYYTHEQGMKRLRISQFDYGSGTEVGAWDTFSETSYAFSQQSSSILGGGEASDFG